jgi:hypothetical protein
MRELPDVGETEARPVPEDQVDVRVRIRLVVARRVDDQPAGHPQMDRQPPPGGEPEHDVLPAPPHPGDRFAGEGLLERLSGGRDRDLGEGHRHRSDGLAGDGVGETACDGLDLGKLGHLSLQHGRRAGICAGARGRRAAPRW